LNNPAQSLQAVSPADCALAIAIPLTREKFLEDLASPVDASFAKHLRATHYQPGASEEYYWEMVYQPVARVAERICAAAKKLEVAVISNAGLSDFTELLERFKVVTLISHWRFARIEPGDLLDPFGFLEAVKSRNTLIEQALHRIFVNSDPELLHESIGSELANTRLIRILNEVIADAHKLYHGDDDNELTGTKRNEVYLISANPLERLTRTAIELAFAKQIAAAPSIQFADGIKTVREVIDSVPAVFSGVLDLTICNSVILGEAIKNYRSACLIAATRYPATLHVRLGIYMLALRMLSSKPRSYIDVLTQLATKEF
jgi:hypothetical protein